MTPAEQIKRRRRNEAFGVAIFIITMLVLLAVFGQGCHAIQDESYQEWDGDPQEACMRFCRDWQMESLVNCGGYPDDFCCELCEDGQEHVDTWTCLVTEIKQGNCSEHDECWEIYDE
jgi:hypothetical protein